MQDFKAICRQIEDDRTQGASVLADLAVKAIYSLAINSINSNRENYFSRLRDSSKNISMLRPSMPVIGNRSSNWVNALQSISHADSAVNVRLIDSFHNSFMENLKNERRMIVSQCSDLLSACNKIITISNSSIVELSISDTGTDCSIVVCESRPAGEGITLSENLLSAGKDVAIIPEAEIHKEMLDTDLVLIGCDAILSHDKSDIKRYSSRPDLETDQAMYFSPADIWVINKTGSAGLLLTARLLGVPAYALFEQDKLVKYADPKGIIAEKPKRLNDPLFESFPASYLTGFIGGNGINRPDHLERSVNSA
jgi:translation initiation factor 2B subunit (eIF-2B alpha/beta/delta family)